MTSADFAKSIEGAKQKGERWQGFCPAHSDKRSRSLSFSDDNDRILLHCFAGCAAEDVVEALGLTMGDLYHNSTTRANGCLRASPAAQRKPERAIPPLPPLDAVLITQLHSALTREQRDFLIEWRCLSDEVIDRYKLGFTQKFHDRRVAIPILDTDGECRDIRCWLPEPYRSDTVAKIFHWEKGRGGARLFPIDQLANGELLLVAGELDALAAISGGFHAITATCSETSWPEALSAAFAGKRVQIVMDDDDAGRRGAEMRALSLARQQAKVEVVAW